MILCIFCLVLDCDFVSAAFSFCSSRLLCSLVRFKSLSFLKLDLVVISLVKN